MSGCGRRAGAGAAPDASPNGSSFGQRFSNSNPASTSRCFLSSPRPKDWRYASNCSCSFVAQCRFKPEQPVRLGPTVEAVAVKTSESWQGLVLTDSTSHYREAPSLAPGRSETLCASWTASTTWYAPARTTAGIGATTTSSPCCPRRAPRPEARATPCRNSADWCASRGTPSPACGSSR